MIPLKQNVCERCQGWLSQHEISCYKKCMSCGFTVLKRVLGVPCLRCAGACDEKLVDSSDDNSSGDTGAS